MRGYYFISNAEISIAGVRSDIIAAVNAGAAVVQYREKAGTTAQLYQEALELRDLCRGKTLFIVNDRVDIALAVDADGVHIGQDDLPLPVVRAMLAPGKIIGVTVRTLAEAVTAADNGADYLGVGPIYATTTKSDAGEPRGLRLLREVRAACSLPLAAIGGISLDTTLEVIAAGADMVCAMSAVVTSQDVTRAVQNFQNLF